MAYVKDTAIVATKYERTPGRAVARAVEGELTITIIGDPDTLKAIALDLRERVLRLAVAAPNVKLQDDDRTPVFVRCSLGEHGCRLIANHAGECDPIEGDEPRRDYYGSHY